MKKYILTSVCEENLEVNIEGVFNTKEDAYNLMREQYEDEFEDCCENMQEDRECLEDCSSLCEDGAMLGWGLLGEPISWGIHEIEI